MPGRVTASDRRERDDERGDEPATEECGGEGLRHPAVGVQVELLPEGIYVLSRRAGKGHVRDSAR